ncbi:protein of unknown function [Latilactobacillus sakei]|uniref:phage tail spike protein n=1 Tax=Latilactobacillus sakei TaxID=1599 RepID=UPI000C6F1413|nr:phage tail spike protein [Latilactobacillus sakei]SON67951.1 protein of unknown function [Latilactobacillus sakei]
MSYPVIYAENATDFFNLGLGTLPDATKVEVAEERNGEFTLVMTYLVDGLRANEIKKNRIIKVDAGHVLKGQRFVIKKINKQLVDRKIQYQVYAEHVSYITNDLQLKPKVSVSGSGDAAIKAWRSNIIDVNPLVVDSDIETNTSTSWTIDKVQSARQALGGVAGSLLDLWGGEYRFDNYHISLKKQRGTVSNTLLSYGRNITDFDQEENITDTYTSVYPYATYTETTENSSDSESKLLTLPELTIDSKYVGNYPNRKILPVDLTAKFAAGEKPTEAKLREFAKSYVTANDIGVPKVSIKLSFVDLSQSSNYEALQLLEALDLCDTVPVRFTKLGVDTKTKVSRVVWDVLADHYTSMELGDTRYTIGDMINNAVDTANEANQNSQEAQNSANHAVISADGHTMIFYGPGTPSAKNIGDLWYKPDGEYEILYRWDGKVWSFVMSTRDTAEAKDAADKASKEAEEAKTQANKAVDGANDAVAKAGFANDTATQAKSDATAAGQQAKDALTNAGTALTNASNALENFNNLNIGGRNLIVRDGELADRMIGTNGQIENYAGSAVTTAIIPIKQGQFLTMSRWGDASDNNFRFAFYDSAGDLIKRDVSSDVTHIVAAPSRSATFRISYPIGLKVKLEYGKFTTDWTAAPQDIQIEITNIDGELKQKVSQTTFDTLKGTVTSQGTLINQNKTEIQLKADLSLVNTIKQTVTNNTATIDLNSKEIKLKASQSDVNKLSGRVTNTESQIKLQADQIALTVSKTELTNILGDYATQTWTQSQIKMTADQINLSVTKVQTNLDNMELGSVNLIIRKDELVDKMIGQNGTIDQFAGSSVTKNIISVEPGKYLTLSRYDSVADNNFRFAFYDSAGAMILRSFDLADTPKVLTVPANAATLRVSYPTGARVKLERGKKGTEYSAAPEDLASEVQFSQLQVTVNGIQGTVQNKADQSQVTQLANQITSVVSDVASINDGGRNYFSNSTFNDPDMSIWSPMPYPDLNLKIIRSEFAGFMNKAAIHIVGTTSHDLNGISQTTNLPGSGDEFAFISFLAATTASGVNTLLHVGCNFIQGTTAVGAGSVNVDLSKLSRRERIKVSIKGPNTWWDHVIVGISPLANKAIDVWMTELKAEVYKFTAWTPAIEDSISKSQITQMKDLINLRVQKGDVINQINISPESILIAGQKVHITGQTSIDNAVIKDAMIADIKADKITAGTLNAANVNVINLNANNITTGTIKGANLSMNLNTGEILFQKGSIRSTNGNLNINIDDGSMSLTNSQGEGAYFIDGKIAMTKNDIWTNSAIHYGQLTFGNNIFGNALGSVSGVLLEGAGGVIVGNKEFNPLTLFGPGKTYPSGGGIAANNSFATVASNGWASIEGGTSYAVPFSTNNPSIVAGISGKYSVPGAWMPTSDKGAASFVKGKLVGLYAEDGGFSNDHGTTADLAAAVDGRSGYILSAATYARTYASGAQMTITANGVFGRISSASKYKLAIGEISTLNDEAHQFLSVKPKQWFDKSESEALADTMTTGNTDYIDDAKALPHTGFIAEDLYTAGLDNYVIRGNDGSIESIQYDRLPVLHHELIRELFNRLDAAEMEIYKLKQEVINNAN